MNALTMSSAPKTYQHPPPLPSHIVPPCYQSCSILTRLSKATPSESSNSTVGISLRLLGNLASADPLCIACTPGDTATPPDVTLSLRHSLAPRALNSTG